MIAETDPAAVAVKLSICIPIYNFGEFIGETLESILPQVTEGVEVVILDGGSTDDTPTVIDSFQRRYPSLRYHRQAERGGIDRDMARTVQLAQGEYCWLFGGDDLMNPDAIARVLQEISGGLDLYLCGFTLCTRDMHKIEEPPVLDLPSGSTFDLGLREDRRTYFRHAATTAPFFSFLAALVFKRERWDSVELDEGFVGSCWAHVARLFQVMRSGLSVRYVGESFLWKRGDNDSFMDNGLIGRYAITIDGYHRLADAFFGHDSFEARQIRRVVAAEYGPRAMLYGKMISRDSPEDRLLLERLVQTTYMDRSLRNQLCRAAYRWTPMSPFRALAIPYMALRRAMHKR